MKRSRTSRRLGDEGAATFTMLKYAAVAGVVIIAGVDAGSVGLAHLAVTDDAQEAGRAAADSVNGQTPTEQVAALAYNQANLVAAQRDEVIVKSSFRVLADGSVRFTMIKTAPTVVLGRFDFSKKWTQVKITYTAQKTPS